MTFKLGDTVKCFGKKQPGRKTRSAIYTGKVVNLQRDGNIEVRVNEPTSTGQSTVVFMPSDLRKTTSSTKTHDLTTELPKIRVTVVPERHMSKSSNLRRYNWKVYVGTKLVRDGVGFSIPEAQKKGKLEANKVKKTLIQKMEDNK